MSAGETYPGTTPPPGGGGGTNPRKPDPGEIIIDDPYPIDPTAVGSTAVSYAPMAAPSSLPGVRYKANGFMEALKFANGITTFFVDDPMGRIQTISSPVYELTYGYDGKGNVTSITGNNGVAVASSYTYSDNDWLVGAAQGQNVYAYVYDAAGNCIRKSVNGVQTTYTYDLPHLNLLSKVNDKTVSHDARGNMILRNDTGYSYIYDQSNQLKEVWKSGASCGKYFYNNEGKRYKKVENGLSTYYVYGGESLLYELKPDGMIIYYIYLNGRQVAKVEREGAVDRKYFYHTDHLGSTRAITNEQGVVVGRFEYQPYGLEETTVTGDDTLTFTGKMMDDPTGLMYFNARYYDPTLGRFITEDPAKDGGNWYVYCNNCPLRYSDPSGKNLKDEVLSAGVDMTPGIGDAKGIAEFFTGYDLITKQKLAWWERGLGLLCLTELRVTIKGAKKGVEVVTNMVEVGSGIGKVVYKNIDEGLNFTNTTLKRMEDPSRFVPVGILQQAIKSTKGLPDPQGTKALMHYTTIHINGKKYNLEVLYDKASNTVLHFLYSREAMGNLPAIPKK